MREIIMTNKPVEKWRNIDTLNMIYLHGIYPDDLYKNMTVITHSRRNFYETNNPIYWYEFLNGGSNITLDSILGKFLLVPGTKYYEYGGYHRDAIKELTNAGVTDIVGGKEI